MKTALARLSLSLLLALSLPAAAGGLAGRWTGSAADGPVELVLDADGSGSYNGTPIRYAVQGGLLAVEGADGLGLYGFRLQGDALTVSGGDLAVPLQLRRAATVAAVKPAMPAAAADAARLAGTWCLASSFTATGGGGSSRSECFTLGADGRYRYGAESSMSAYGGGMWGGTASQAADSGRWSLAGNTLTAQSDGGAVRRYRLELRNHPRNVRDPMICLDGDCYVTQVQRAPW